MRAMPLFMAAMLPMAAAADQNLQSANWDYEQLRGSWRVSEIIGSEVQANDGSEYGEIKDVVLSTDGKIQSVLVESDGAMTREGGAMQEERTRADREGEEREQFGAERRNVAVEEQGAQRDRAQDDARVFTDDARVGQLESEEGGLADRHDASVQDDTNYMARDDLQRLPAEASDADDEMRVSSEQNQYGGAATRQDGLAELEWRNPSFNADESVVRLDVGQQTRTVAASGSEAATGTAGSQGGIRASELIGMDVNLADEESYGEVEDVLVSADGEATALVVDSWNFLTKDRYAIPVELNNVNMEENQIDYQLSSDEVEGFGEFEFDEYLETT